MTTITPSRQTRHMRETGAPLLAATLVSASTTVADHSSENKHLLAANAMLTAKQSRQLKKLEPVRDLILSQEPLAIIPTLIDFTISMTTHHEKISQRYAAVTKFSTKDDDGVLYVPKSACINIPITCSDKLKENKKAKLLIEEGEKKCVAARIAIADTMRKMAQLELETALNLRKADFIKFSLTICEDLIFHTIRNENKGNTKRTIEELAFICFHTYGQETLEKADFFTKFLGGTQLNDKSIYDVMLSIAAPTHDAETDNLMLPLVTANETLTLVSVFETMDNFFIKITLDLKTELDTDRKIKEDNARVIARRKAKDIAAATEATAESLETEPVADYKTMLALIKDESEKAAKKTSKAYVQNALQKKSSGNHPPATATPTPTTAGGKKSKNKSGDSKRNNKKVSFKEKAEAGTKAPASPDKPKQTKNKKRNTDNNKKEAKNAKRRPKQQTNNTSDKKSNRRGDKRKGKEKESGGKKKQKQRR